MNRCGPEPVRKVAQDRLIFVPFYEIIIICSIQTQLSILRFLTQSCVTLLHMKTQFSKLSTNVGDYALTYPKNTGIVRYGTASALWVLTQTERNHDRILDN